MSYLNTSPGSAPRYKACPMCGRPYEIDFEKKSSYIIAPDGRLVGARHAKGIYEDLKLAERVELEKLS